MPTAAESSKTTETAQASPIVVDIGKKRRKQIKQLREGRGKLMEEVNGLLDELRSNGSITASAQPVIIVVRQKRKNQSLLWPLT